jgi:hypothetical protein
MMKDARMTGNGEIITRFPDSSKEADTRVLTRKGVRRCRRCGIRKVLEVGFYRESTCREGYRPECKKCRNAYRRDWARKRYQPGRRGRYRRPGYEAA